jgi:hypothetical protein
MTEPSLDRAATAVGELSSSVRTLTQEVIASESLRTSKIKWIQRLLYVMVPAVVLLVIMAVSNFALLNRAADTAENVRSTNELLLGCLQPDTACNKANARASAALLDNIRQTQFVIAVCQRLNPVDKDPDGSGIVRCVQDYYPGFALPNKVG